MPIVISKKSKGEKESME